MILFLLLSFGLFFLACGLGVALDYVTSREIRRSLKTGRSAR